MFSPAIEYVNHDRYFRDALLIYFTMENSKTSLDEANTLHTTRNGIRARGIYDGDQFEVLEGSEIDMNRKCHSEKMEKQRQTALQTGNIVKNGEKYRLNVSISFASPSAAATFVLGGSINGWTEWKGKDGKTLDEMFRK